MTEKMIARRKEALALRNEGKTYQEIGEIMGISKQRVHHLIGQENIHLFREITPEKCAFVGLRDWMNSNKVCVAELTRRLYGHSNPNQQKYVRERIANKSNFQKDFIDKVLQLTGLTYESAFKLDK